MLPPIVIAPAARIIAGIVGTAIARKLWPKQLKIDIHW